MKTKSGINRMTKAAIILILTITVQIGYSQVFGLYNQNSKKKALKRTYKCQHVGVQKVKHIQGRGKQVNIIPVLSRSNEIVVASLSETTTEFIKPIIVIEEENKPVEPKKTELKDSINEKTMRLLPLPVYFRYDSYRLDIIDLSQIAIAVSYVKGGYSITLIGHTDNWGSEQYNAVLSDKRANIIRDMMIKLGCKPELITAKGEGEKYPIDTNEHHEGRQSNRRVEFIIALN